MSDSIGIESKSSPIVDQQTIQLYQEILEKTNAQLSMAWTPYATVVAILALLFGAMAIIVAYAIYSQSSGVKRRNEIFIGEYQKKLDAIVDANNKQVESWKMSVDLFIQDAKERIVENGRPAEEVSKVYIESLQRMRENLFQNEYKFRHSGFDGRDILVRKPINKSSLFNCTVWLSNAGQEFTVYLRLECSDGIQRWIGWRNSKNPDREIRNNKECTLNFNFDNNFAEISENIFDIFKERFSAVRANPKSVISVRIRGEDETRTPIDFAFGFS